MGRATIGCYVVEGHLLTITYGDGKPFHGRSGEKITLRLQAGDDPTVIAKRLRCRFNVRRGGAGWRASTGRSTIETKAMPEKEQRIARQHKP